MNPTRPHSFPLTPPVASSPAVRAVMRGNSVVSTKPELALRSELHRQGLRYHVHRAPIVSIRCRADVVFARARVAVFVDGCFWHRCPEHGTSPSINSPYWQAKLDRNVARDQRNNTMLAEAGWLILRVWEHEIVEDAADRIAAAVVARSTQDNHQAHRSSP